MEITAEILEKKLRDEFQASHVEVIDETTGGCGQKFSTVIVSEKFEGKPLLQRHRLVNSCLAEELKTIHAFSMKTLTQADWTKRQQQQAS
ncbi:bolA-like protein 2 [Strongylocentrotus purpuratus]|uniref:BolA-like protein 2 n=1 Tax=Strongylocentrotus purpuratus TaxID=7668 RepID=A0A7M7FZZ6_STRPU|nr:bolA-like protein 2 [Strongylocentrotus purpuratus]|eukprot:XP_001185918.1 PREDICTED: bolA-like protein 2 [Strongylocentrotus purpuratus]